MNLQKLKSILTRHFFILYWNPTNAELQTLADLIERAIQLNPRVTLGQFKDTLLANIHGATYGILEGEDNSDLITLLQVAEEAQ